MNKLTPNSTGYWWAKGRGPNADLGWQMFVVDSTPCGLVVRLAIALHTRLPWFKPAAARWHKWKQVKP